MLVKECMTRQVEIGYPEMSLEEVAQKMREGDFGLLPIGEKDRLTGMITDRDIVIRAVAEGKNLQKTQAKEIMSSKVLYCFEDQTVDDVSQNLGDNQIRRLPVLNRQKRLVGILSLGDLAHTHEKTEKIHQALERISTPSIQPEIRF